MLFESLLNALHFLNMSVHLILGVLKGLINISDFVIDLFKRSELGAEFLRENLLKHYLVSLSSVKTSFDDLFSPLMVELIETLDTVDLFWALDLASSFEPILLRPLGFAHELFHFINDSCFLFISGNDIGLCDSKVSLEVFISFIKLFKEAVFVYLNLGHLLSVSNLKAFKNTPFSVFIELFKLKNMLFKSW